jgi:hypothetical protein
MLLRGEQRPTAPPQELVICFVRLALKMVPVLGTLADKNKNGGATASKVALADVDFPWSIFFFFLSSASSISLN